MTIVMQRDIPGLYTSDLIDGRFQVIQSSGIRTHFFIYDHTKDENVTDRLGMLVRFTSADAAHDFLAGRSSNDAAVVKVKTSKVKVVKTPKVKAEKAPRKARMVTAGAVDVRERKERKGSTLSIIRDLIRKGGDDEAVFKELKELIPNATYGLKTVVILRKEMGLT